MKTSIQKSSLTPLFLVLLILVLTSNFLLYRTPLSSIITPADAHWVVIGSLLDFSIVAPFLILALTHKKGYSIKRFITWMVIGIIAARIIIPAHYFEPFKYVPIAALALEVVLILAEIGLIFIMIRQLPIIIRDAKAHALSPLYSFPESVGKRVSKHPLVQIIAAETIMFYYAFATYKKVAPTGPNYFSLHKKTSMTAFYIMLIHSIVIETIGFHWWLHDKSIVISIVLLVLNIYSVIYIIGDIQTVRLNPLFVNERKIHVSLGLGKRMTIPFESISSIKWGKEAAEVNLKDKGILQFIARDLETRPPDCIIELKEPLEATLFMGMKKSYLTVAIKLDDPEQFKTLVDSTL